jgi:hypothetical protein
MLRFRTILRWFYAPLVRSVDAEVAFETLGKRAAPAVVTLAEELRNARGPCAQRNILAALESLNSQEVDIGIAVPTLLAAEARTNSFRASYFGKRPYMASRHKGFLLSVATCVSNADPVVRLQAVKELWRSGVLTTEVLHPLLANNDVEVRAYAAEMLKALPPDAEPSQTPDSRR